MSRDVSIPQRSRLVDAWNSEPFWRLRRSPLAIISLAVVSLLILGALFAHTAVDTHDPIANLKYRYMVREDGWKLILPYLPNRDVTLMINGAVAEWMRFEPELYNVLEDPHEMRNLAAERPDMVEAMRDELERWWWVDGE